MGIIETARAIKNGEKKLDDVPDNLRRQVKRVLETPESLVLSQPVKRHKGMRPIRPRVVKGF